MKEETAIQEPVHLVHISRDEGGQGIPDYFVHLTFEFVEEDGQWCGNCVELGTAAFADTLEQARVELSDATNLQLTGVERLNELPEYLDKNGVSRFPIRVPIHEEEVFTAAVPV